MKVFLTDQRNNFDKLLKQFINTPVATFDLHRLKEKTSVIHINTKKKIQELNLDFLFDYKIFPTHILGALTQWEHEQRKMKMGDTIVQQIFIPPIKNFSQKLLFGVRINSIVEEELRKGFSYQTLQGHVELGESIFTIEQESDRLNFKIQTFSTPGNAITKLLGPVFSLPYQSWCTKKVLENVKRQIEAQSNA
ncbi:hypothetical protein WSM22_23920 [Cytophagales bacterium WSM2-2]|nr:hypothetical protein WSM22_23920 [Cytophagales bacterium WSM2-2]